MTVIDTATNSVTSNVAVGSQPEGIAITPDGKTAGNVANSGANTVTPIDVATGKADSDIVVVLQRLTAIALTPKDTTARMWSTTTPMP